jgi:CheY-like chemotaxis protein
LTRTPKRILVLDDEQARHDVFASILKNEAAVHCYNFDELISLMTFSPRFDMVFLDHDLGTGNSELSDQVGLPTATGYNVALFICQDLDFEKRPRKILIHSWNEYGAEKMESLFRRSGFQDVVRKPFRAS